MKKGIMKSAVTGLIFLCSCSTTVQVNTSTSESNINNLCNDIQNSSCSHEQISTKQFDVLLFSSGHQKEISQDSIEHYCELLNNINGSTLIFFHNIKMSNGKYGAPNQFLKSTQTTNWSCNKKFLRNSFALDEIHALNNEKLSKSKDLISYTFNVYPRNGQYRSYPIASEKFIIPEKLNIEQGDIYTLRDFKFKSSTNTEKLTPVVLIIK